MPSNLIITLNDVSVLPPIIYGPSAPGFPVKKDQLWSLSTNAIFYQTILQQPGKKLGGSQIPSPITVDVREVALAHILALTAPPASEVGRKRLIVGGENQNFTWKQAVEHLALVRPELKERLPDATVEHVRVGSILDNSRAREVLGLESIDWRKTVEDAADSLMALEKSWATEPEVAGVPISLPSALVIPALHG